MSSNRHGLMAKCVVLDNESREGFDTLLAGFLERFAPTDSVELGLVEEMFSAFWRQRRAWAIETRLHRNFQIALANLILMRSPQELNPPQNIRLQNEPSPISGQSAEPPPDETIQLPNEPSPISGRLAAPVSKPDPPPLARDSSDFPSSEF